jgi:hypothetical protein
MDNMTMLNIELTEQEVDYIIIELNEILKQYKQEYNGKRFDNKDMASAFNKVYKALTNIDHENVRRF